MSTAKPIKRLDDEDLEKYAKKELPQMVKDIKKAMEENFPGYAYELKVDESDNSIHLNGLSLIPVPVVCKSIRGSFETPGWQFTSWKEDFGTRETPPDLQEVPISEHRSSFEAIRMLIVGMIEYQLLNWFQAEDEARAYAEMK